MAPDQAGQLTELTGLATCPGLRVASDSAEARRAQSVHLQAPELAGRATETLIGVGVADAAVIVDGASIAHEAGVFVEAHAADAVSDGVERGQVPGGRGDGRLLLLLRCLAGHAREVVGVEGFCGDLDQADGVGQFNAVTLNRVLEHVVGPREMLAKVKRFLLPGGFVYVEVPDGEMAAIEGPEREEFGIDHWHIFSATSLALLISRSGFVLETLERLRDPSGKFTLRAFIVAPGQ